jgi:hypothetical protein
MLVRLVPLVFGALLGGLADSTAIGLFVAMAVSLAFDWSMEDKSLVRALLGCFRQR